MKTSTKKVRIVLPAFESDTTIEECIQAIHQSASYLQDWELVVADNGGNTVLESLQSNYAFEIIKCEEIASAAYARNKASQAFSQGVLVFIDSDVIIEKDCLKNLLNPILINGEVATIGNYSKNVDELSFAQQYKQLYIHYIYSCSESKIRNDFWTAISAIDAKVFHDVGAFDSSFTGANGEDQDLGIRLTKKGYSVVSALNATGRHTKPYTISSIIKNDFNKGLQAVANSISNQVQLKDNRHAKYSSIFATLFATLSFASLFFIPFSIANINLSIALLLIWFLFRARLLFLFLVNQGIFFAIKALPLIWILDLVRFLSVLIGSSRFILIRKFQLSNSN